jgi:acyl transferase domain-containing protein/acyl carrier protein
MPLVALRRDGAALDALDALASDGFATFLGFGELPSVAERGAPASALVAVPSGAGRAEALLALARLYALGCAVDFAALYPDETRHARLPTYPWQRVRYWFTDFLPKEAQVHPLLERRHASALGALSIEGRISSKRPSYLVDHRLFDRIIAPAVLYLEGAFAALRADMGETAVLGLADVIFHEALIVSPGEERAVQMIFDDAPEGRRFQILNRPLAANAAPAWTLCASGRVEIAQAAPERLHLQAAMAHLAPFSAEAFYDGFWRNGGQLGPSFRVVRELFCGPGAVLARIALPDGIATPDGHVIHPALLDSGFHLPNLLALLAGEDTLHVPIGVARITVHRPVPAGALWCRLDLPEAGSVPESFTVGFGLFDGDGAPVITVAGLRMKRMRREAVSRVEREELDGWLHTPAWAPVAAPAESAARGRRWLVIAEAEATRTALAGALAARGDLPVLAPPGFDGASVDACRAMLDRHLKGDGALFGVLYLPALPPEELAADESRLAQPPEALCVLLHLAQALVQRSPAAPLWLVTQGAWSVGTDRHAPDPRLAALWGLGRTIALEHPDFWGGAVDIDPAATAERAAAALAPALDMAGEDQLALRAGTVHAVRLLERPRPAFREWRAAAFEEGTWLVAGGSGAIGSRVAHWLVERGVRHLVLLSRSGVEDARMASLRRAGAVICSISADVADCAEVETELAKALADLPPLVGVVHAAGVGADAAFMQQDRGHLSRAWAPKAAGAWNLHRVTRAMPVRHFVLFSSAAGLMGSPGQAAYAAANAFLDGLAQHRRAEGLPAVSLDWGPWAATGMMAAGGEAASRAWTARGIALMPPEIGVRLFELALTAEPAVDLAPMAIDWAQWSRVAPSRSSLAGRPQVPASSSAPSAEWQQLCAELDAALPAQREQLVLAFARTEVGRILGFAKDQTIDPRRGFFELGMDSMMAVAFRAALQTCLGRPLSQTLAFDHPNLAALAGFLLAEAGFTRGAADEKPPARGSRAAPLAARAGEPAASTRRAAEPIAIIGMGCRFPGGVVDAESFWSLLENGIDAIREVPRERWDIDAYFDPDPQAPGKTYTRWGGFLDRIEDFDASFFGISPREAAGMDPQQRLLLEVAWEALEDAGIAPPSLAGSQTGVFVGLATDDFTQVQLRCGDTRAIDAYSFTGTAYSVAGGRLSSHLGLRGPNLSIDTACSSSLVAAHVACQSLRSGESDLALVGGVNVMLSPELFVYFSKLRAMAKDGRCKTFDAGADGYARGEGCGVIVLRRRSDAEACGDRVLALIRGSAVAHDGQSGGLTVPNGSAQQAVIKQALANGGVLPSEVNYVQAHGTGTPLGDPIEANALGAVLREGRAHDHPLYVGSVKTNIGHTEAAAGVAGLMAVVLAMRHGTIPAHLHFTELNPRIALAEVPAMIPKESVPWSNWRGAPRVGGVSSFGFSGTNAHVVLEEAPPGPVPASDGRTSHIVHLSARCAASLAAAAERLAGFIGRHPEAPLGDIAWSANLGRSELEERLAVVAPFSEVLRQRLLDASAGSMPEGAFRGRRREEPVRPVFLFTGQGSQYPGMGRDLYANEPAFREAIDRCDEILRPLLGRSAVELMHRQDGGSSALHETRFTQPCLFAFEYALAELWRAFGIVPAAVIGHSVGEIVAACVARAVSLEDALHLVAERGRLMQELPAGGAMAAVAAPEERVTPLLEGLADRLAVAAVNGPREVVITGDAAAVDAVSATLAQSGIKVRRLTVSHAFHSPLMDPMVEAFAAALSPLRFSSPLLPLVSNVTGRLFERGEVPDANYWHRHVRATVRFAAGLDTLWQAGHRLFLEIGPHPVLSGLGRVQYDGEAALWLPSLRGGQESASLMLQSLAQLYAAGASVDWDGVERARPARRLSLPTYPFQRRRHWPSSDLHRVGAAGPAERPASSARERLLGRRISSPVLRQTVFETRLSVEDALVSDHFIFGKPVLAASVMLTIIVEAGRALHGKVPLEIVDARFVKAMVFPRRGRRVVQLVLTPAGQDHDFELLSFPEGAEANWMLHAHGRLGRVVLPPSADDAAVRASRCVPSLDGARFYAALRRAGVHLGPRFAWLYQFAHSKGELVFTFRADRPEDEADGFSVPPGALDCPIQSMPLLATREPLPSEGTLLPLRIRRLVLPGAPRRAASCQLIREAGDDASVTGSVTVLDAAGEVVAVAEGLTLGLVPREALLGAEAAAEGGEIASYCHVLDWEALPAPVAGADGGRGLWLILEDGRGVGAALSAELAAAGAACLLARPGEAFVIDGVRATLNPLDPEHFLRLLASINGVPCRGIIHLFSLDATPAGATDETTLARDAARDAAGLLHAAQAVARVGAGRLWVALDGASLGGAAAAPPSAALLRGLGRTIALEYPEIWGGLVELGDVPAEVAAAALAAEIVAGDCEDWIAYEGTRRFGARLRKSPEAAHAATPPLRSDGTYLVTGGLGGLGAQVARWLVEHGARHLVLVGRRPADEQAAALIRELEQRGARILARTADIAVRGEMEALFAEIAAAQLSLCGVIHAAGVVVDTALLQTRWSAMEAVLRPKMMGAWLLHEATRHLPLDFFVLFSSAAAPLGHPGQASYAAANAFLDGIARHRAALGLPALSIDWGPWEGAGMAGRLDAVGRERLAAHGFGLLLPAAALELLGRLLETSAPQVLAARIDWSRWAAQFPAGAVPPIFPADGETAPARAPWLDIAGLSPDERRRRLSDHIRELAARELAFGGVLPCSDSQPLRELGIDSLMAVNLRNRLAASVGLALPATLLFDHPTVAALTAFIDAQLMPEPAAAEEEPTPLELLSENELAARLAAKLEAIGS